MSELFPVFLKLRGRRVLLVGGGVVATGKLRPLIDAGAIVTVVAPRISDAIRASGVSVHERPFEPSDLDDAWFVVAAATREVNGQVARAAEERRLFVNAVDDVENASVYLGAIVRRAGVTLAISTDGHAPALAGLIREALEVVLPNELDAWMDCAREARTRWLAEGVPMEQRRALLLNALVELYRERAAASEPRARSGEPGAPASARVGGPGGAKPPGQERAAASEPRARSGEPGAPASAPVGGSGGAKPPGKEMEDRRPLLLNALVELYDSRLAGSRQ